MEALQMVNFTIKTGDQVWFDSTGAAVARYEVVNWQRGANGSVQFKPVGYYDASLPPGEKFVLRTNDIMWPGGKTEADTFYLFFSTYKCIYICLHICLQRNNNYASKSPSSFL